MIQGPEKIQLTLGKASFPLYLGVEAIEDLVNGLLGLDPDRILLVTDSRIRDLHGEPLCTHLSALKPVLEIVESPGESVKSIARLARRAEEAISWGATRRSVVVAFGGGAIGNFGGLLAALLFRGIRLVHIPTTLLAAMDSVVSLKQAVNAPSGKNLIGTYYAPEAVFVRIAFLRTLPEREIRSALCEVMKNALAVRPEMLSGLRDILNPECHLSDNNLEWILRESILTKADILKDDGFEKGSGLRFEYGHTVGHAIEHLDHRAHGEHGLSHGESIGVGMAIAADIASNLGFMNSEFAELHRTLLRQAACPTDLPTHISPGEVEQALANDNKRGLTRGPSDHICMILLREPGIAEGPVDQPLVSVPVSLVRHVLEVSAKRAEIRGGRGQRAVA